MSLIQLDKDEVQCTTDFFIVHLIYNYINYLNSSYITICYSLLLCNISFPKRVRKVNLFLVWFENAKITYIFFCN